MRSIAFSILFLLLNCNFMFAQNEAEQKKRIEQIEREIEKKQNEYVNDFIASLNVDEFQKEIIKQKIHAYFEAKKSIYMAISEQHKRDELVEKLDTTHFLDIKDMVTEDTMVKIMESVKGTAKNNDKDKKKKKKNKKTND